MGSIGDEKSGFREAEEFGVFPKGRRESFEAEEIEGGEF